MCMDCDTHVLTHFHGTYKHSSLHPTSHIWLVRTLIFYSTYMKWSARCNLWIKVTKLDPEKFKSDMCSLFLLWVTLHLWSLMVKLPRGLFQNPILVVSWKKENCGTIRVCSQNCQSCSDFQPLCDKIFFCFAKYNKWFWVWWIFVFQNDSLSCLPHSSNLLQHSAFFRSFCGHAALIYFPLNGLKYVFEWTIIASLYGLA